MNKFKNKYRINSIRLQKWNYAWNAAYFITICTKNRKHFFGEIVKGKMELSKIGVITDILWYEIKNHSKNVELGEFVVMPNHIHGILILKNDNIDNADTVNNNINDNVNDNVETRHALSLQPPQSPQPPQSTRQSPQTIGQKRFQNQGKNTVSSIIGGYQTRPPVGF